MSDYQRTQLVNILVQNGWDRDEAEALNDEMLIAMADIYFR